MKTPQEWQICNWSRGGEVIDSRAVAQRIDDLDDEHLDDEGELILVELWPSVAREERAALVTLLSEIGSNMDNGWDLSANGDSVLIVRDTHLEEYVKHWYDDTYGGDLCVQDGYGNVTPLSWSDLMDREPFGFIDWSRVADSWRDRCAQVEYHGVTYFLDH